MSTLVMKFCHIQLEQMLCEVQQVSHSGLIYIQHVTAYIKKDDTLPLSMLNKFNIYCYSHLCC